MEGARTTAGSAKTGPVASASASTLAAVSASASAAAGPGIAGLPELPVQLAVRRIELSWVREQRRRSRQAEGAAVHIQRIYRGQLGRRRFGKPVGAGDLAAGETIQGDGGTMLAGGAGASQGVMTAASYHRQKLRATKQRADGWRPPGP